MTAETSPKTGTICIVEAIPQPWRQMIVALMEGKDAAEARATAAESANREAYDQGMDDAADQILAWLASAVGGEDYIPCDGTEEWGGDVHGTIYAILKAGRVLDDEDGRIAKIDDLTRATAAEAQLAANRERKTFPILNSGGARFDYQLVADHGGQAKANHYQTVDRLAERGGLSWQELHAVLLDRKFQKVDQNTAIVECRAIEGRYLAALEPNAAAHPDDAAVDRFAIAMKAKLAKKRADGRGGWEGPDCTAAFLSQLLREHVEKGDPVDVGNFAMMLHQRDERIVPILSALERP
ncbi:hypothetical protein JI664_14770 [Rhodobacter sp. NTK016B]|uniref:hypothetical protein n=1 Tax=Rhodobacter sp. NTK016B TaxID=2759676 RepID=UPI001A8E7756|nr:hypothetical protein [Rhodobacter sp. NTK016B]MBN8293235.1 hypothetical protein [Rhodobacter sp. NTK016B]